MQCNLPTAIGGASFLLAAYVAISLTGFIRVARRGQQRLFFFIAGSASLYCLLDVALAQVASAPGRLGLGVVQGLCAGVHAALWIRCAGEELGPLPGRLQRTAEAAAVAAALVAFAVVPSATGRSSAALPAVVAVALALPFLRYARATRSRSSEAWLLCVAIALPVLAAAGEGLAAAFALPAPPHLLFDSGLAAGICLVGLALSRRWSSDLRAMDELTASLERRVNERTQAREHAWYALSRADRFAAVSRLAGGMAHEINNPGSALIANMEYLLDGGVRQGKLPPDAVQTLEDSLTAARRITSTVRQLLLVSRVAAGDRGDATFNIPAVIGQAVRTVEHALGKRVAIRVEAAQNIVARGRGLLLEQALVHLLTNGVLAVPKDRKDGEVRVVAEFWEGVLVLQIIDNGVGMDDAVTQRLFEPFFTTRPPGDGAGLGLAVSLGLLQALGGEVRVESTPGKGTTMTLVLEASTQPLVPDQELPGPGAAKSTQAA
jgi:signal transduction histidine kinase